MAFRGGDESKTNSSKLSTTHSQRTGGPTVDRVRKEQIKGGLFTSAPKNLNRHDDEEAEEAFGKLATSSSNAPKTVGPFASKSDRNLPSESISEAELAESLKLLEELGKGASAPATGAGTVQAKPKHVSHQPPARSAPPTASASFNQGQQAHPEWSKLDSATASKQPHPLKPVNATLRSNADDEEEEEALPAVAFHKAPPTATASAALNSSVSSATRTLVTSASSSSSKVDAQKQATNSGAASRPTLAQLSATQSKVGDAESEEGVGDDEDEEDEDEDIQFVPKSQRGRTGGEKMNELRQSIVASKQMAFGFATNERKVVSLDQVSGASAVDDTDRPNDIVEWESFLARRKEREPRLKGILGS